MLGFVGFLKKKLDLEGKLPDKWKDVQLPKYYCFTRLENMQMYCYIKSEDGFGSDIQIYTRESAASGGGAFVLASSTEDLDSVIESNVNAYKNGKMSWDGVSDTGYRSNYGQTLAWTRSSENDLY